MLACVVDIIIAPERCISESIVGGVWEAFHARQAWHAIPTYHVQTPRQIYSVVNQDGGLVGDQHFLRSGEPNLLGYAETRQSGVHEPGSLNTTTKKRGSSRNRSDKQELTFGTSLVVILCFFAMNVGADWVSVVSRDTRRQQG